MAAARRRRNSPEVEWLQAVNDAFDARADAQAHLEDTVAGALADPAGPSLRTIAAATGLTHEGVRRMALRADARTNA